MSFYVSNDSMVLIKRMTGNETSSLYRYQAIVTKLNFQNREIRNTAFQSFNLHSRIFLKLVDREDSTCREISPGSASFPGVTAGSQPV